MWQRPPEVAPYVDSGFHAGILWQVLEIDGQSEWEWPASRGFCATFTTRSNLGHPVSISLMESEQVQDEDILKIAHNYELPPAVKLALNADFKQANAVALITSLFVSGLLTLAQMVSGDQSGDAGWEALRFFIYSAIILNLSGAILCLMIIKMCTDLPPYAQQMVVLDEMSWPSRAARGETLPKELLANHWLLLSQFGMMRKYQVMDALLVIMVLFGGLYAFVAVILWVWLTESHAVAAATMISAVPAVATVVYSLANHSEGWR